MDLNNLIGVSPQTTFQTSLLSSSGLSEAEQSVLAFNAYQAEKERQFNAEQAELQRKENRYLSDTAYSRAVKDLKSVGINPYAFAQSGSSPVVSTAPATATTARGTFSTGDKNRYSSNLALAGTALTALVRLIAMG